MDDLQGREALQTRAEVLLRELALLKRRLRRGSTDQRESIHDTRVASRRVRAALEAFRDLYPAASWAALYAEVRSITRALGRPRQTEVVFRLLGGLPASESIAAAVSREHVSERLRRKLRRQHRRMGTRLAAVSVRALGSEIGRLAAPGESPPGADSMERAGRVIGELSIPVLSFDADRSASAPDDRLHRLRIAVKKLRYALEIFSPHTPGGLENQITLARAFQDAAGDYLDWTALRNDLEREFQRISRRDSPHLARELARLAAGVDQRRAELHGHIRPALTALQTGLVVPGPPRPAARTRPSRGAQSQGGARAAARRK